MVGKYITLLRNTSGFDRLESREKVIVLIGIVFLLLFVFLQFVVGPYVNASRRLDASIAKKKADLVELQLLQQEYRNLKAEAGGIKEQIRERPGNFSLFSFLDEKATEAEVKGYIGYMKPSTSEGEGELLESIVEMKLQQITLGKLVDYLKLIESPENVVSVKRISIQESGKDEGLLEVIIQIMTFIDNGGVDGSR